MALVKPRDKGVCLNLYLYFNVNWVVCTTFRRRFSYDRRHCSLAEIIRATEAEINLSCTKFAQGAVMSIYLRPKVPGASVFFTVNLMTRGSRLLVDEIDRLREAVRTTRAERPFQIDAWVVLPDHLHAVWTLPPGDADFSTRWGAIKSRFTMSLNRSYRRPGFSPAYGVIRRELRDAHPACCFLGIEFTFYGRCRAVTLARHLDTSRTFELREVKQGRDDVRS